jgi:homoserine O-acetyltransferase
MRRIERIGLIAVLVILLGAGLSTVSAEEIKLTPQYYHVKNFKLQSGAVLEDLKMEYATFGTPQKDSEGNITNAVVWCHGFSGNYTQIMASKAVIGPGKPLDTNKYFFIFPTAIGSPGSSCPSVSGLGPKFPKYTVEDMVSAQYLLVTKHMNIKHLAGVAGPSMGGYQTLQWITMYPDFMDWAIPIATAAKTQGLSVVWTIALIEIIKLDPAYKGGYYTEQPKKGMEVQFLAGYARYFSREYYATKWKTNEELIEGVKNIGLGSAKADANDTIWRREALISYDVLDQLPNVKARVLVIGVNQDQIFPRKEAIMPIVEAIPGAEVFSYDSILGHVGCAFHLSKASQAITDFLK